MQPVHLHLGRPLLLIAELWPAPYSCPLATEWRRVKNLQYSDSHGHPSSVASCDIASRWYLGLVAPHLMTFSKMSFCIAYQACSSVSMHALNTHDAPLGPQPPLMPQFPRGYCHRTALHVGSKRASNRAPKHYLCALERRISRCFQALSPSHICATGAHITQL